MTSLQPGKENAFRLERLGGQWFRASVRGTLLDRGWVAGIGFPALIPGDGGEEISGYLFCSPQLESAWPELDAFEGSDYERVSIRVSIAGGQITEADLLRQCSRMNADPSLD